MVEIEESDGDNILAGNYNPRQFRAMYTAIQNRAEIRPTGEMYNPRIRRRFSMRNLTWMQIFGMGCCWTLLFYLVVIAPILKLILPYVNDEKSENGTFEAATGTFNSSGNSTLFKQ